LRDVVVDCLDSGRILIPRSDGRRSHAEDRMDERHITAPEIEAVLRSGVHRTDSCVAGKWRYGARKNHLEVIFTFDLDDEGNLLVIVTVMRKENKS
jgi:hypothetical protein